MARTRTAKHSKPVEPEDESQEVPEEAAVPPGPQDKGSISKSESARQAIAAGLESPEEATEFIRKKFGIEMSKPHFSAVKSQLKKREGGAKPKGRSGRKPKAAVEGYLAPPPKIVPTGEGDLLDAMEVMKPLIASLGPEKVKRIVDLLC
jgi:hypothetical protein